MNEILTTQNILFLIVTLSTFANIVIALRKPKEKSELNDALFSQAMENLKAMLDERFKSVERKFEGVDKQFLIFEKNHIHTIDTKVDENRKIINQLDKSIVQLTTIINERIPKQ